MWVLMGELETKAIGAQLPQSQLGLISISTKPPKQYKYQREISQLGLVSQSIKTYLKQRKNKRKTKNKQEGVYRVLEKRLGVIFSWFEGGFLLLLLSVCLALTAIVALHYLSFSLSVHSSHSESGISIGALYILNQKKKVNIVRKEDPPRNFYNFLKNCVISYQLID